jgi:hypothetical protein
MLLRFDIHVVRVIGRIDDTALQSKGCEAFILNEWFNILMEMDVYETIYTRNILSWTCGQQQLPYWTVCKSRCRCGDIR